MLRAFAISFVHIYKLKSFKVYQMLTYNKLLIETIYIYCDKILMYNI